MRVAVAHDWLTGMRGGEKVLEAVLEIFPDAEVFTLLHVPGSVSRRIEDRPIHTSFVNKLPFVDTKYRYYLPLFPRAIEHLHPRDFDLVISNSHCVAKGIQPGPGVPHICYCNTPMRYIWEMYDEYFDAGRAPLPVRAVMPLLASRLRRWDAGTAERVTSFVSNSRHIRDRIGRCYDRDADVIYPPVDVERFDAGGPREDFYLIVSALVPYKRIDLAIAAFNRLGRRLVIAGAGPERESLERAAGPNIEFTGWVSDEVVTDLMQRCRAFIFPATEDFGITAVEAQAAGAPVIAHASGGALETVLGARAAGDEWESATGVFFKRRTPQSLCDAVEQFESMVFDTNALRANASRFAPGVFDRGMRAHIEKVLAGGS